jgi:hypothetical protein
MKRLRTAAYVPNWSSVAGALEGVTRFFGLPLDTTDVMGLSGEAFVLRVPSGEGGLFDHRPHLEPNEAARYNLLGLRWEHAPTGGPEDARRAARKAIDAGSPAIVFGLFVPEYGLITGYDDRTRQFAVSTQLDEQGRLVLPYDRWPVAGSDRHGVLRVAGRAKIERDEALRQALSQASGLALTSVTALEAWAIALATGSPVAATGNAHAIQVTLTSRFRAASFLDRVGEEMRAGLAEASACYRAAGLAYSRLATLFPYPNGGEVNEPFLRQEAARLLRQSQAHEREASERIAAVRAAS